MRKSNTEDKRQKSKDKSLDKFKVYDKR
jgi:hypothetical protein